MSPVPLSHLQYILGPHPWVLRFDPFYLPLVQVRRSKSKASQVGDVDPDAPVVRGNDVTVVGVARCRDIQAFSDKDSIDRSVLGIPGASLNVGGPMPVHHHLLHVQGGKHLLCRTLSHILIAVQANYHLFPIGNPFADLLLEVLQEELSRTPISLQGPVIELMLHVSCVKSILTFDRPVSCHHSGAMIVPSLKFAGDPASQARSIRFQLARSGECIIHHHDSTAPCHLSFVWWPHVLGRVHIVGQGGFTLADSIGVQSFVPALTWWQLWWVQTVFCQQAHIGITGSSLTEEVFLFGGGALNWKGPCLYQKNS